MCTCFLLVIRCTPCYIATLTFQSSLQQREIDQVCTQLHIGYPTKCEQNTILCRYPGNSVRAPSMNSALAKKSLTLPLCNKNVRFSADEVCITIKGSELFHNYFIRFGLLSSLVTVFHPKSQYHTNTRPMLSKNRLYYPGHSSP